MNFCVQKFVIFILQMKREDNRLKKIVILSFSVVYLFIALTYVGFLPNYTSHASRHDHAFTAIYGIKDNYVPMQKFFKATPPGKKDQSNGLLLVVLTAICLAPLFVIRQVFVMPRGELSAYAVLHRHTYLQYRSLRI